MPLPTITDFLYPLQWNLSLMNVQGAWNELYAINPNIAFGDPNIIIAVIDTGIQSNENNGVVYAVHPDLKGNVPNLNTTKVIGFYNSITKEFNNNNVIANHGGSVACIISGSINGQGTIGVAPNTRLIGIIKPILTNSSLDSNLADVINWANGLNSKIGNALAEGASIVNYSLEYIDQTAYNNSNQTEADKSIRKVWDAIDNITSLGRNGLGSLFVASSGNGEYNSITGRIEGVDLIKGTRLGIYKKVIAVGATKYTAINAGATPTESVADYSNFGVQLDVVAPAGIHAAPAPGTNFIPNQAFTTFAGSNFNAGNCPGNSDFQLILKNNVSPSINDAILRVDSIEGIFQGQSILVHSANNFSNNQIDILIVKDIQTDSGTPPYKIITPPVRFSHSIGDLISIATQLTKLNSSVTASATNLSVIDAYGFYDGQQLIIGDISGIYETITISPNGVDLATNTLTITNGVINNYASGTLIIAKTKVETTYLGKFSSGIKVSNNTGFFRGQKIGIEVPSDITTIHAGKNTRLYEERIIKDPIIDGSGNNGLILNESVTDIHTISSSPVRTRYGHWTSEFSGTSAAAPFVSGTIALILSAKPLLNWLEVKNILTITTDKIGNLLYTPSGVLSRNDYYGYGRVNANNAVVAAKNYSYDSRDLMLRDELSDTGLSTTTTVNSPDIWVRNLPDISYSPPANYMTPGSHQNPNKLVQKKIYIRVKNIGSSLPSIEGAEVKCFVAFTNQTNPTFQFPDFWQENLNNSSGENVIYIGSQELPSISVNSEHIAEILWDSSLQLPNPQNLQAYLLVHISPFDRGITANTVQSNNNLSYKSIIFSTINFKSGTGTGSLQKTVPVDSTGVGENLPFKVELQNTEIAFANNIEVKATITYRNGNAPETVTFKYNGSSWAFITPPSSGWLTLNAPVLSGTNANGIQEFTTFSGALTIDNTASKITFESEQFDGSSVSVLKQDYTLNVTFNYPVPESGVAPEKKTAIYTFADFDLLPVQSGTNNFGPVSSVLTTEYRTWNSFTGIQSGTALKAYAATNGEFFIQEVTGNPNVVNLVIKPDNQPANKIGLVKYFVYRGLKKGSFLDGSGQVLPSSTSGLSELLTRMWVVRNTLNTEAGITETIKRNDLGLDEGASTLPSTMLIEDVFDTYVFQKLSPGMSIGEFETTGDYGFQIIVEGPNYKPTLADLRVLDHKVIITYQSGQPQFDNGAEEDIKTKLDREQILSFVDSAAYFGLMAFDKILVNKSSGVTTISNDAALVKIELLDKFATSNQIYVDIRNDLNNSLNFYGSYSDITLPTKVAKIKFKNSSGTFIDKEYHTNGWPILTIPTADILSDTTDVVKVSFQLPEGDNNLPGLFLSGSSFFADGLKYKEKFKILNITSSLTDDFELSVANIASTSTVLPFILKLSYTRRYDIDNLQAIPAPLTRPWKDDYIDNLLTLNEVNITPPTNDPSFLNTVKWNTCSELKYIGWTSNKGFDFVFRNGVAKDKDGIILFGFTENQEKNNGSTNFQVKSGINFNYRSLKNINFYKSLSEDLKLIKINKRELQIGSNTNFTLQVDSVYDNLSVDILNKTVDTLISIAISNSELVTLQSLINNSFINKGSSYYAFTNHNLNEDNNENVYFVADLLIQGIVYNTSDFSYSIQRMPTTIKLYSIDGKNYLSENYVTNSNFSSIFI